MCRFFQSWCVLHFHTRIPELYCNTYYLVILISADSFLDPLSPLNRKIIYQKRHFSEVLRFGTGSCSAEVIHREQLIELSSGSRTLSLSEEFGPFYSSISVDCWRYPLLMCSVRYFHRVIIIILLKGEIFTAVTHLCFHWIFCLFAYFIFSETGVCNGGKGTPTVNHYWIYSTVCIWGSVPMVRLPLDSSHRMKAAKHCTA